MSRLFSKHLSAMFPFITFCIIFVFTFSPISAFAAVTQQENEVPQMVLGQFVRASAQEGDVLTYQLTLEGGGTYVLFSQNDEQAANFSFSVTGANSGEVASGDTFAETEFELEPDEYTISFTAKADAELSAVVVGDYGRLSADQDAPGALYNGSHIKQRRIRDTLYATLTLPETDYFQLLHIWLVGAEGDSYDIQVNSDDMYEFGSSYDETELGIQFWTKGGEFEVEIEPTDGGKSLELMVLLSGPAEQIEKETPTNITVGGDHPDHNFTVDVENAGSVVTLIATPDSDDANYQLSVGLNPETQIETLYVYGAEAKLTFLAPFVGRYVVNLTNDSEPVEFTIIAIEDDLAPELPVNGRVWGKVEAGNDAVYRMQIDDSGDLLSLILLGNNTDLDLQAKLINENGEVVHGMSLYGGSSIAEIVSQSDAQAGMYEVRVKNQYGQDDGKFVLSSRLENPLDFAGQWAIEATASSEYDVDRYTAMQATGEPNTPIPGDYPTAWASKEADAGEETLELTYEAPVSPFAVQIYETNAPGAVVRIEAFNAEDEEWVVLWEGSEPTDEVFRVFSPELEVVDFATEKIRLTLDSAAVSGWNEIDAVKLIGLPQ